MGIIGKIYLALILLGCLIPVFQFVSACIMVFTSKCEHKRWLFKNYLLGVLNLMVNLYPAHLVSEYFESDFFEAYLKLSVFFLVVFHIIIISLPPPTLNK